MESMRQDKGVIKMTQDEEIAKLKEYLVKTLKIVDELQEKVKQLEEKVGQVQVPKGDGLSDLYPWIDDLCC
jgi:uncharacterized coiled-coil protein SlyX